jgi:hypothetical protein
MDAAARDPSVPDLASICRRVSADVSFGATFVVVTGAPAAGRTRLCELVVKHAGPLSFPLVIETAPDDFDALVVDMLQRFGLLGNAGRNKGALSHDDLVAVMRRFLRSMSSLNGRVLLLFDEAHQLKPQLIEQLHALTTFQPEGHAVLQAVLVGEPPLIDMLRADDLRDIEPTISRQYHLQSFEPPRSNRRVDTRHAASVVSRWWLALAVTPALIILAFTGSWAIRHDVVFSAKPGNDLGNRAISGYLSPEIASPATGDRSTPVTYVKIDHRVVLGGSASPKPVDRSSAQVALDEILGRAATFAAKPDVKALVKLRDEIANRAAHSTDDTESEAMASTLKSLDRRLEEAQRLQLEIDGRRLAGDGGRRAATDPPPSQ